MGLDLLGADDEDLGDLTVGLSRRGHARDSQLAGSQGFDSGAHHVAGPGPRCRELGAGTFLERRRAATVGDLETLGQRLASLLAAVGTPQGGAELDQRLGVLEPCPSVGEELDRATQILNALLTLDDQPLDAKSNPDAPLPSRLLGEIEALSRQAPGL